MAESIGREPNALQLEVARAMRLVDFLMVRLAEQRDDAEAMTHFRAEGEYHSCPAVRDPEWAGDLEVGEEFCDCGMPHAKAEILKRVEVHRAIVRQCESFYEGNDQDPIGVMEILQGLASLFSDHPDYRDEWRP